MKKVIIISFMFSSCFVIFLLNRSYWGILTEWLMDNIKTYKHHLKMLLIRQIDKRYNL